MSNQDQPGRALRIAHAISAPVAGGAEIYVRDLAAELVRQGHEPLILFVSRAADVGSSEQFERAFLAQLDDKGIAYAFIGHASRSNPLLGIWRVRRICRARRIQIYHSHLKYALAFGAGLGIPHVHTHHNIRPRTPLWMYPAFNRLVDAWVGISDVCADYLRNFTGRPVTTIHNAVDPRRVAPNGGFERSVDGTLQCIAVGRVGEQKNLGPLLDALALLGEEARSALHVKIVGEGTAEAIAALEARIRDTGLERTVTLLGNREDVADLLRGAQLFLMTSAWEGLPIALLEATMSGLPFIATAVGGCPEVAARCGNGIIVPVNDPAAIARELRGLLSDPGRLAALSRAAVRNGDAFAIAPCVERHVALYRALLDARSTERRRKE